MAGVRGLGETEWHMYHSNFNRQRSGPEIDRVLKERKTSEMPVEEILEEKKSAVQNKDQESILPENN
jgi:hypothetical protein